MNDKKLEIAVVGAGSVGQVYAGLLAADGHEVTLVARPGRAEALQKNGLVLRHGRRRPEVVRVTRVVSALPKGRRFDHVLIAVRFEQLPRIMQDLEQWESRSGALVICTAIWGPDPMFTLPNFDERLVLVPGLIAGNVDDAVRYSLTRTAVGPFEGAVTETSSSLAQVLCKAGIPTRTRPDLGHHYIVQLAVALPWAIAIERKGFDLTALAKDREERTLTARAAREAVRLARKRSRRSLQGATLAAAISGEVVGIGGRIMAPLTRWGWGQVAWDHLRKIARQDREMLVQLATWAEAEGESAPAIGELLSR